MKILYTGSTSKQVNSEAYKKAHVNRIDDSTLLCDQLSRLGHEVIRREVLPGENLDEFDLAMIGIGPVGSSNYSKYIMGAFWAMHAAKKVLLWHEDWKIHETISTMRNALSKDFDSFIIDKKWSNGTPFYRNAELYKGKTDILYDCIEKVLLGEFKVACPGFKFGDIDNISKYLGNDVCKIDISPAVISKYGISKIENTNKKKEYVLSTLGNFDSWIEKQNFSWNINYFGNKKNGIILDSERAVFEKSAEYWGGNVCPEYPHSGSGWFRSRFIYAAYGGTFLVASEKDLSMLGLPKLNIEELDEIDLIYESNLQSQAILDNLSSMEEFSNQLKEAIEI